VVVKDGVVEKIKRIPASQIVYDIIQKSPQGIDTANLMKATKFDQRKIHNITFRLKKLGRITTGSATPEGRFTRIPLRQAHC
jgi:hypothetical protein